MPAQHQNTGSGIAARSIICENGCGGVCGAALEEHCGPRFAAFRRADAAGLRLCRVRLFRLLLRGDAAVSKVSQIQGHTEGPAGRCDHLGPRHHGRAENARKCRSAGFRYKYAAAVQCDLRPAGCGHLRLCGLKLQAFFASDGARPISPFPDRLQGGRQYRLGRHRELSRLSGAHRLVGVLGWDVV